MAVVKKARRTAFVPRLLVRTAIIGVIPACALGCGSKDAPAPATDAAADSPFLGVAAVAYPAYEAGVPFSVAQIGYDASFRGEAGPVEAGPVDGGPADARPDAFHGFVLAVTAYEVDRPKEG